VSIKKTSLNSPKWLKYFIIASLFIHVTLMWSLVIMSKKGGWLAHIRTAVKEPVYVQVVELPPKYKASKLNRNPRGETKRYANKTSIVEKEEIPKNNGRLIIHPAAKAGARHKARPRKASKAVKGQKKIAGTAKPRRIFKTKKDSAKGKNAKKAKTRPQKTAQKKTAPKPSQEKAVKAAKLSPTRIEVAKEGEVLLKSSKIQAPKERKQSKKTLKKKEVIAPKHRSAVNGKAGNPRAGQKEIRASTPSRPNLVLSEGQVTRLTRKYQSSAPTSKSKTLMLNTSELKYQSYLIEIKHKIEQYWDYPRIAAMRGWEGKLIIDLTIKSDGTLSEIHLSRSSRYPILDDAAITAIKLSSPFTNFPKDFDIEEIKIHGQFVYTLIGMPQH